MPSFGSCLVCSHVQAEDINRELLAPGMNRRSLRGVALLFHLSPETTRRHFQRCLGQGDVKDMAIDLQQQELTNGITISLTHEHIAKMLDLDERVQACGNPVQMMVLVRELVKLLASIVKAYNR